MKNKYIVTFLCCMLTALMLSKSYVFAEPKWVNYTSINTINDLAVDNQNLWEATTGGLVKRNLTNPKDVVVYTMSNSMLPNNFVQRIYIDDNGDKWVGTYEGLAHIDKDNNWGVYFTTSGLLNNNIKAICKDRNNNLLVGTELGISYMTPDGQWNSYKSGEHTVLKGEVLSIEVDLQNNKWIGTNVGVFKLNANGTWEDYSKNLKLPSSTITSLGIDNNKVWIGTDKGIGYVLSDTFRKIQSGADKKINDISIYSNGDKWISTDNGILEYTQDGHINIYDQNTSKILSNDIKAIVVDKNNIKWIGTSSGLCRFSNDIFENYDNDINYLPSNEVNTMNFDKKGNKWFGTLKGLVKLDKSGQFTVYNNLNSNIPSNTILSTNVDNDGIWVGTNHGIGHLKNDVFEVYNSSNTPVLKSDEVYAIKTDKKGDKWFGTSNGIYTLRKGVWEQFIISNQLLSNGKINHIEIDNDNNKWVSTSEGLLFISETNNTRLYSKDDLRIVDNNIYMVSVDDNNNKWVGTGSGVVYLDKDGTVKNYIVEKGGLPDSDVLSIAVDKINGKWFGTNDGLAYLKSDGQFKVFDYSNIKLTSNYINEIKIDENGGKWFATNAGISYFEPTQEEQVASNIALTKEKNKYLIGMLINYGLGAIILIILVVILYKMYKSDVFKKLILMLKDIKINIKR